MSELEQIDLLLLHGTVVTMDANYHVHPDGAVVVHQGRIVAVGAADELAARFAASEVLDCQGCAVLPGLINAHAMCP